MKSSVQYLSGPEGALCEDDILPAVFGPVKVIFAAGADPRCACEKAIETTGGDYARP